MKELLAYQEIDSKIGKIEELISENPDRQNALKMQQFLKDAQNKLAVLTSKSEKLSADFQNYKQIYDKNIKSLDVINKNASVEDEKKLESLIDANDAVFDNFGKLEKEFSAIIASIDGIQKEFDFIMKNARNAKANMEKYKASFATFKAEKDAEISKLKKELDAQALKVDKTLLAKYRVKRSDKKPVLVRLIDGRCGGCRMEVSAAGLNKLKSHKSIECENCGRYIYVE